MNVKLKMCSLAISSLFAALLVSGCNATSAVSPSEPSMAIATEFHNTANAGIRIATWNVEHLAYPIDQGCRPRTQQEFNALKLYASELQADVVALQEVASKEAVQQLFPSDDWQVVMSNRPDSEAYVCRESGRPSSQQKVAFAVRKSLEIKSVEQLSELALDSRGLRFGLSVQIQLDQEILSLLNVHLKSGCFVDDYQKSDSSSCATFAKQAPILDSWIEQKEQQRSPYVVLGDFNHRLSAPYNRLTRAITTNQDGKAASLQLLTQNLIGCHPRYPAPIDHIAAGALPNSLIAQNVFIHRFNNMQESEMLSDHCAVSVELKPRHFPLTSAVKWQTESKEYSLISQAIYRDASKAIAKPKTTNKPWVVVMDVDETVLDNSAYQVWLDETGGKYTSQSWNDWVQAGQAGLVPGVKKFMETVTEHGGKFALVTNRDKRFDGFTWRNMLALDLPISEQNTCLMGRSDADKAAVKDARYTNDKDLRREQVTTGRASCYSASHAKLPSWQVPHTIIMQIGDNIEDIDHVLQESAVSSKILERWGKDVFILPNPMYGSW